MSRYAWWARGERGEVERIAAVVPLAPIFLGVLPATVVGLGSRTDRRLGLRPLPVGATGRLAAAAVATAGFALGLSTVLAQLDRGRGTPLPILPTQRLLTDGPYHYCRNPMALGALLGYLGIAVAGRTTAGVGLVLILGGGLALYVKRLEEPELAERFGEAYVAYRRSTPFLVPSLPVRHLIARVRSPVRPGGASFR